MPSRFPGPFRGVTNSLASTVTTAVASIREGLQVQPSDLLEVHPPSFFSTRATHVTLRPPSLTRPLTRSKVPPNLIPTSGNRIPRVAMAPRNRLSHHRADLSPPEPRFMFSTTGNLSQSFHHRYGRISSRRHHPSTRYIPPLGLLAAPTSRLTPSPHH